MIEIKGDFKMNKTILIATLAIVFVAGCTQANLTTIFQQTTNTVIAGAGMVMTDFSADQTDVFGGQTDRIMMTVSNMGGHSVPDSDSLVYLTGSAVSLSGDNTIYWTGPTETLIKKFVKEMKPADPIRDTPADEKTISWSLKAPNVSRGQKTTYLFIGRVYYDYQTKVNGNIWVYSETEADTSKTAGKTLNKATWSATSGPVAINAKVSQDPVILYSGENTITLVIKVSSVGGGVLYKQGSIDYSITDPNSLALTSDEINRVLISGNVAGTPLPSDCTNSGQPVELIGGKDATLTCDVTITPPATFQGYPITITADYGYFNERTASVTVSGR
jgi:hypothetical protein